MIMMVNQHCTYELVNSRKTSERLIPFLLVPIIVGHERTVYTTSEGGGQVELCVVIFEPSSGGAPREFNLTITTENGTAG